VKDFATKRIRVEGIIEPVSASVKSIHIGRWILMGLIVCVMVGYALWNHHHKKESKNLPAVVPASAPSTTTSAPSSSPASSASKSSSDEDSSAVQFDFYHVLASDSGKEMVAPKMELVQSQKLPVVSEKPKTVPNEPSPGVEKPEAPVDSASTVSTPKPEEVKPISKPVVKPKKIEWYEVEVSTFTDKNKAQSLRGKLMLMGFEPQVSLIKGKYIVHFAPTRDAQKAQMLKQQLMKAGMNASLKSVLVDASHA
jgi:cell division septation protein DedD